MNVLQVAPFSAYPPTSGGQNRVHGLMMGHEQSDTVTRFATVSLDDEPGLVEIDPNYREYRFRSYRLSLVGFIGSQFGAGQILSSIGLRFSQPSRLSELAAESDIIIVEFPWQVPYVESIRPSGVPLVYSSHNFEDEEYGFLANSVLTKPLYSRAKTIERRAVELADLVVVTSERDKQLYMDRFGAGGTFYVAPNGAFRDEITEPRDYGPSSNSGYIAIFAGTTHAPNVEAVEQILRVAREDRIQQYPIKFRILGTICHEFTDRDIPENVELVGFVGNLSAEYRAADIGLNPALSGGGSNVKMAEYFAHGLAVVTTEYGFRGVPAEPGQHCIVNKDDSFAEALIFLLREGHQKIEQLGSEARKLAAKKLNWETISEKLFEKLQNVIE